MGFGKAHNVIGQLWIFAALIVIMLGAVTWFACERSAGDQITKARTAYAQHRLDEAEELFEAALDTEENNVEALVGLANIHIDREEIDRAAERFAALDRLELERRDEVLVRQARRRYLGLIYDRSRGDGPVRPDDPVQYEEALIGLFNIEGTEQYLSELISWLMYQARRTLAVPDITSRLAPDSHYVREAPTDRLRAALAGYERLVQRDPRVTRVLRLPDAIDREAQEMILALQLLIFEREFQERFDSRLRATLLEEGRFNPQTEMLTIRLEDQYPGEIPPDDQLEAFQQTVARDLVIDELTTLAFLAKGMERGNSPSLTIGRTVAEVEEAYAAIEIITFEIDRNRRVTVEVLAPFYLLTQTAFRLEQYLQWRATRSEEVVQEGTGAGTAMGTGDDLGDEPEIDSESGVEQTDTP